MRRKRLRFIIALLILAVMIGGLGWITNATLRQEHLNRALIAAIKENNSRKALTLLDEGADPNARDNPQVPPSFLQMLMLLLRRHYQDTDRPTALLLALGVRVEFDTHKNSTAMSGSPDKDNLQIVQALCDHGADMNGRSTWGYTPIMAAAFAEAPTSIIKLLLDRGAGVNARDIRGQTALMLAAGNWNVANVRLLLERGADVKARDKQESTALIETVRKTDDPPSTNTDGMIHKTLEVLLDHGADVNAQDDAGMTALMHLFLSTEGETDTCAHLLIERGANIHLKNHRGETATPCPTR
ncbi:MAG TPA: ankyrin repeat domain-containing protein [Chthonomonadaceae bacterium]|nr:ankyrin repeat domain-containing protein [Chthonomonadaceae bacterium]